MYWKIAVKGAFYVWIFANVKKCRIFRMKGKYLLAPIQEEIIQNAQFIRDLFKALFKCPLTNAKLSHTLLKLIF